MSDTSNKTSRLFRWHRGGLAESMATVQPVESIAHMATFFEEEVWGHVDPEDLTVEPYGCEERMPIFDERCGWNMHIVKLNGDPVGWTNGELS